MKAKLNVEFPCGYKYHCDFQVGVMSFAIMDAEGKPPSKCPLHGKQCPPRRVK